MSLRFKNGYPKTIWTMIEWYSPDCADGAVWERAGWWKIAPGATATVYGGDLDDVNRYWYFYAHAANDAQWSGPYRTSAPYDAFDMCSNVANTDSRGVGMRELDVNGDDTYTVTFVP